MFKTSNKTSTWKNYFCALNFVCQPIKASYSCSWHSSLNSSIYMCKSHWIDNLRVLYRVTLNTDKNGCNDKQTYISLLKKKRTIYRDKVGQRNKHAHGVDRKKEKKKKEANEDRRARVRGRHGAWQFTDAAMFPAARRRSVGCTQPVTSSSHCKLLNEKVSCRQTYLG